MSTRTETRRFMGVGVVLCSIWLTTGTVAPVVLGRARAKISLEEVIHCVQANEEKLSLIKMDFRTDFTSEGSVPDHGRGHPLASGESNRTHYRRTQWAQDGIRQRFAEQMFNEHGMTLSAISVVDGETYRASHLPEMKRGKIMAMSRYNRWQVNFASRLFYHPLNDPQGRSYPPLSESLAAVEVLSDVSIQELNGRDVFVLDIRSGTPLRCIKRKTVLGFQFPVEQRATVTVGRNTGMFA